MSAGRQFLGRTKPTRLAFSLAMAGLAGCSGLPVSGPSTSAVIKGAAPPSAPMAPAQYQVIDLTNAMAQAIAASPHAGLLASFGDNADPRLNTIQPGDYVSVSLWDVSAADLLSNTQVVGSSASSSSSSSNTLAQGASTPDQIVATDGTIAIPFAGRVKVGGLTTDHAAQKIEDSLKGKVARPQAIVSISRDLASSVTVAGDGMKGSDVPLATNSDRLLDVIAISGGTLGPSYQTEIRLIRGGRAARIGLQAVLENPSENIHLHPQDVLVVSKNANFFTALGAVGTPAQIQFAYDRVSVAQAIGLVGGLQDQRADAEGVFIFRFEDKTIAEKVCGSCASGSARTIPIVYRFDLKQPQSLFVAQNFFVRDKDVIFVSNAPKAQLQKALNLFGAIVSPVTAGVDLGAGASRF